VTANIAKKAIPYSWATLSQSTSVKSIENSDIVLSERLTLFGANIDDYDCHFLASRAFKGAAVTIDLVGFN